MPLCDILNCGAKCVAVRSLCLRNCVRQAAGAVFDSSRDRVAVPRPRHKCPPARKGRWAFVGGPDLVLTSYKSQMGNSFITVFDAYRPPELSEI